MFLPVDEQIRRIRAGAESIVPADELVAKLERSAREARPLLIKQGFDPTRPDLHIGHAVSIHKLRTFQELGHRVVFVMGDFTARVGDPSGRDETRPVLSEEEIESNLATYEDQVFRILDPAATEIRKNSEWLAGLALADILRLTSQYTVARMLERDDFAARHREGRPISLVEFLYPMMQAYDSVALRADVELGGTDQRFNLLLGRTLQERAGQEPQVCLIMPLLRGTDGRRKMSKSYDNYIGISMEAEEAFGRVMSIPDSLLDEWLVLASGARPGELAERRAGAATDPLATKRWLAERIVARYQGAAAAGNAMEAFDRIHRRRQVPENLATTALSLGEGEAMWIGHVLRDSGLAPSSSEAGRLIRQGAVRVDGGVVEDRDLRLGPGAYVVQRGKRSFVRVLIQPGKLTPDGE
ncbi:MAG: tyrosine--tRNA ligase [Gemmatimonadales bacterium]|nr:tyrosine--tRNA ligase [Gemmatimonadales bacterium]MYG49416.1 tyrosine--tRNA ligase [Gemmatimonadales bacterium]MYK02241.1 tyrosine--tRNA ligase [Candidatus Palauibacter ramosifaciens]